MYETYFGLTERPFSIAPDPQYLYMSKRHKEAMAHLSYGITQGGCFVVLTGEVGTGKTTLCRNLLGELPSNVDVALILNANINELELLQSICDELKIGYSEQSSQKKLLDSINQHLLATFADNRHTVLIIDEAQLLSRDVLEQIRLLTNLETTKSKLLQIILIGQPELNDLLTRNDLRQLAQRVTARYHLGPLHRSEIEDYVNFRLSVAGCKQPLFSRQALNKLHLLTHGIPRKINVLADHALLATYAKTATVVDAKTISASSNDVFFESSAASSKAKSLFGRITPTSSGSKWVFAASALIALNVFLWWIFSDFGHQRQGQVVLVESVGAEVDENSSGASREKTDLLTVEPAISSEITEVNDQERFNDLTQQSNSTAQVEIAETTGANIGKVFYSDEPLDMSANLPNSLRESLADELGDEQLLSAQTEVAEIDLNRNSRLLRLLETSADKTGRINALRALAQQWGGQLPTQLIQPACELVLGLGLKCLGFQDWAQWRRYNRPGVIVLSHNQQLHRVLVTALDDDRATLMIGDEVLEIDSQELRALWVDQGLIFVRQSSTGTPFLQLGDNGERVVLARQRLNQALISANLPTLETVTNPEFDLDMAQKLFALQTRFNIVSDSKIGNETWLLIDEILNSNEQLVLQRRV